MRKEGRMPKPVEHPTIDERAAKGKAARATVPRAANAEWDPSRRVHRPLELLAEQDETRAPDLVPIRYGRMAASPFAYYRGAALPMAADLATMSHSHLTVQLCGDAHLSNFGGFASPEREMLFDVNDFDETLPGPFEWDVKRLAASLEVAARGRACDRVTARNIVRAAVRSYRLAIQEFASMTNLAVWYARLDVPEVINRWGGTASKKVTAEFERDLAKAQTRDQLKALRPPDSYGRRRTPLPLRPTVAGPRARAARQCRGRGPGCDGPRIIASVSENLAGVTAGTFSSDTDTPTWPARSSVSAA